MASVGERAAQRSKTLEAPVYGSDEAIAELRPTYGLGGMPEPSREELAAIQKGPYLLHAKGGKLDSLVTRPV